MMANKLRLIDILAIGLALFALGVGSAWADDRQAVRKPLGVFAHLDIEVVEQQVIKNNQTGSALTPRQLHAGLRQIYASLLANPAISGITAGMHWDHIQPADPVCVYTRSCPSDTDGGSDFSFLDDVFAEANWAHKSVQLLITPGVNSPGWVLSKIPSCDGLFDGSGHAAADCGKVTFSAFPEQTSPQRADGDVLPLPWNPIYNATWEDFLLHLSYRYASNPAFTYIAVAGPVCASDEMILPTSGNHSTQASGLPADKAWSQLISHSFPFIPGYQDNDQAFIDAWKQTIDSFQRIFSGVTLVISPDSGDALPEFLSTVTPHPDNFLFQTDCATATGYQMSCEAKTEVLSYFVRSRGPNAKGGSVGGMQASTDVTPGDIGIAGLKVMTSLRPPFPPPILGGAEFDFPVSDKNTEQQQGCPKGQPNCTITPEEAAYNTFTVFFWGTRAATEFGGQPGQAPIEFVELDQSDVIFAENESCPTPANTLPGNPSLQDLLNRASNALAMLARKPITPQPPACR